MTDKLRQAIEQTVAILGPEAPLCSGCVEEWTEALRILRAALAEQRSDGMPSSSDERHLRRLLAARVGMPNTYYDDGEAHGVEYGINIDFMREPVADIDAKLRALNVARAALAEQPAEPVAWIDPKHLEWLRQSPDNMTGAGLAARKPKNSDLVPLYTAPQPAKRKPLTDEEIDRVTDVQWASNNHKPIYAAHRAYARAVIAAYERKNGIGGAV